MTKAQDHMSPSQKEVIASQLATLQGMDVLVLNEADWGMKRTEYRDVTRVSNIESVMSSNTPFRLQLYASSGNP